MAMTPPERLYARIRAAVEATPAATMRTRTRILVALAIVPLLMIVVVSIASEVVYGEPAAGLHIDVLSVVAMLATVVLLAALVVASTFFALWQGRTGLGIGSLSLMSIAALVVPVYAALTVLRPLHSGAADDVALTGVAISPWGLRCLFVATVVSVPVLAILAAAVRRAAAVSSKLRGAALGAAAGAWGGFAVFVFCPSGSLQHLLVGHVLPIAIFTLVGAVALSRLLQP
ncbi:MAG TPA: NrsF family protein [Steroidobacteraceae bacterium]|jgi:hypothetical protein